MAPLEQLKTILNNKYESEDGDSYKVELLEGMSDDEVTAFVNRLPQRILPVEIGELLRFARGFEFGSLEIRFDQHGQFGFESLFPDSIQLAGDGFGNFWVLDIDSNGNWGNVYYVCHDPAVVVKHSETLADFIKHVDEFGEKGDLSHLDQVHEKVVFDIWKAENGSMQRLSENTSVRDTFKEEFSEALIADLRGKPINAGFAWALLGPECQIRRIGDDPTWIISKKSKQGFWSTLFSRRKKKKE